MEKKTRSRKQQVSPAAEGLWSSDFRFRSLLENLPQKAGIKDINSVYIFCNERFAQELKIRPDEVHGRTDYDFYPKYLAEKHQAEDKRIMESGKAEEIEERQIQDGQEVVISKSKSPVKDIDGNTVGILLSFWDITRYKFAEDNLKLANAYNRSLIEAIPDPFFTISPEGKITDVNRATEETTGIPRGNLIGSDFSEYFAEPDKAKEWYSNVFFQGFVKDYPLTLRHTSGSMIAVMFNASVYKDETGKVQRVVAAARDVSEIHKREEIINRQAQEILDISMPVLQVWESVVVAPLIGMLDSQRTYKFMERFLNTIVETNSPVAMIDITGVPAIDTQTAQHLIETITAAHLLGTKVILTGVRPAIAQTLVHLGVDLSDIETCASMKVGLRLALEMVGLKVVRKNDHA